MSGQEANHQKGADSSFESFHGDIELKGFRARACSGRWDGGRSALHSHYFFDIGVIPTGTQDDLDV